MGFSICIPARYGSERLPGKVLLKIHNKTILQRAYECAKLADPENIYIFCDHEMVADHAISFGAKVIMTDPGCPNGTSRIATALEESNNNLNFLDEDIIVNLQADEIVMPKEYIRLVATSLSQSLSCSVATLAKPMISLKSLLDPNIVKVVRDINNKALYFSRSAIPCIKNGFTDDSFRQYQATYLQHIGLYAYRVKFLKQYNKLTVTDLETIESLEQLRVLGNGYSIYVSEVSELPTIEINTQEDLLNAALRLI